jgi:hypothetical protein
LIKEFQEDFIKSKNVYINMNDGKGLISNNMVILNKRMSIKDNKTTFIFCDYNNNNIMNLLSLKNNHYINYYSSKIKDLIDYHFKNDFEDKCKTAGHNLSVRLNKSYNMLSIILTDNYANYIVYRVSKSRKTSVPHYVFSKNSKEFNEIINDIENMCKDESSYPVNYDDVD